MTALANGWRKARANFASLADVWLFANIVALACVLPVGLRGLSLPRLLAWLTPRPRQLMLRDTDESAYVAKLVKFTDYVLNRNIGPLRQNCLRRSLLLYTFLRGVGVDVDVCMGVKRVQSTASVASLLDGHAWLLLDNQPFLEPCAQLPVLYTVTYRYPSASRTAMTNVQAAVVTREMQLLLACGRQSWSEHAGQEVKDLADRNIDWPAFIELAAAHGLLNVAYQALKARTPLRVPPDIVAQLRQQLLANAAHNTLLTHELTQLVALFAQANIDVLAYKGPVLSTLLYGSVAARGFNDLDLLVRPQNVDRARALLISRGYRSRLQLEWEHSFVCADDQRMVDLHWAFTGNAFRLVLDFDSVWQDAQRVTIGNQSVPTLSLHDTLILQCINAAKDDWVSLSQIYEIGQFIHFYALDWAAFLARAKTVGCERIVKLAMWLAQRLFGAPLAMEVQRANASDATVRKLGEQVLARLLDNETPSGVVNDCFRAQMREQLRDKLPAYRRILRFAFSPNEKDRDFVALPVHLSWLYILVRPLRLLIKHASFRKFVSRPQS